MGFRTRAGCSGGNTRAMQIGINGSALTALASPLDAIADHAAQAERDGFPTYWLAQSMWPDALAAIAAIGRSTSTINFGTTVIPTWGRHPLVLAGQALTTNHVINGRLVLGIGLSHRPTVEQTYRVPFSRPARHMTEYLDVLLPALNDHMVDATGDVWSAYVEGFGVAPDTPAPSVMLAAMGPRMLEQAGTRTHGTILWLSGPKVIDQRIRPALTEAAEAAGRPAPSIIASVPISVTDNPGKVRELVGAVLDNYNHLPSYREVMDIEGVSGPEDVAVIGSAPEVTERLQAFASAGVTEFSAVEITMDDDEREATPRSSEELQLPVAARASELHAMTVGPAVRHPMRSGRVFGPRI